MRKFRSPPCANKSNRKVRQKNPNSTLTSSSAKKSPHKFPTKFSIVTRAPRNAITAPRLPKPPPNSAAAAACAFCRTRSRKFAARKITTSFCAKRAAEFCTPWSPLPLQKKERRRARPDGASPAKLKRWRPFRRARAASKIRGVPREHRRRLARKSRPRCLRCCHSRPERKNYRATEKIYRPHDEQRRGILRAHRGARLRTVEPHQRAAHRERLRTAGEADARPIQSEERRPKASSRAREENVAIVCVVSHRARLPRAERGSRRACE